MAKYRLTHAAQSDIASILAWSHDQFGEEARQRYEALNITAIRDAATPRGDETGRTLHPPALDRGTGRLRRTAPHRTCGTAARLAP